MLKTVLEEVEKEQAERVVLVLVCPHTTKKDGFF